MKKLLVIGRSGCGKTTLLQRLREEPIEYKKTQSVEITGNVIDTPGEYMEHKKMFRALVVTCMDAELAVLVQAAPDTDCTFFPGMRGILNMPITGVISKTDLACAEDIKRAHALLEMAGAETVFEVSAYTDQGIQAFREYIDKI